MTGRELVGDTVALRPLAAEDVAVLQSIHRSPSVRRWWGDPAEGWPRNEADVDQRAVWHRGELVGFVQWVENEDPTYRHAGIDLFLDESVQGRGLGRQVVQLVVDHLVGVRGHHRIVIDPAAENERAIRCYSACGFVPVGVMRRYERNVDGDGWHDGMLMELVVEP